MRLFIAVEWLKGSSLAVSESPPVLRAQLAKLGHNAGSGHIEYVGALEGVCIICYCASI